MSPPLLAPDTANKCGVEESLLLLWNWVLLEYIEFNDNQKAFKHFREA